MLEPESVLEPEEVVGTKNCNQREEEQWNTMKEEWECAHPAGPLML